LDPLTRSVFRVTTVLANVSSVFQLYEELHHLYYLYNMKHREGDGLQHVARMGHMRNV
jgi:hypothetical protein